jgi:hypothetical protein
VNTYNLLKEMSDEYIIYIQKIYRIVIKTLFFGINYYWELFIDIENIIYANVVVSRGEVNESRHRFKMQGMRSQVPCHYPEYML